MSNIKEILKLYNLYKLDKYDKYISMFKEFDYSNIKYILPDHILSNYQIEYDNILSELSEIDVDEYRLIYDKIINIDENLYEASLDIPIYNIMLEQEKNETILNNLKSFKGYAYKAKKIKYNFSSTVTGRLTIDNSICGNILTLPKRCRKIFKSSWNYEGSLISVDFKSLEPRIVKKITSDEKYEDIYETIKDLSEINVDRSVIKRAVISTLYGSELNVDYLTKEKSDELIKICYDFFNIDKVIDIANNSLLKNNKSRKNLFGRPINNLNETKNHIIMNNYIQSSAVDVALMYFYELINKVEKDKCKPLFIIHDAIIFDIKNDYIDCFKEIVDVGYNCEKLGYFPVELTDFINNKG